MDGEDVRVVYVKKEDAKRIKTQLECVGRLNQDFRLSVSCSDTHCIAVPVLLDNEQDDEWESCLVDLGEESRSIILGLGYQFCPYNASRGNRQQQSKQKHASLSLVQQALLASCQAYRYKINKHQANSIVVDRIHSLSASSCPRRLELLGDDRTLVLPLRAFRSDDPTFVKFLSEILGVPQVMAEDVEAFLMELWKTLAQLYNSSRVVRRGGVDPQSPIRESNYCVLWPRLGNGSNNNLETGPGSSGWLTVTEQGIRQSFDLTRIMFCRGNISEKIRFGKQLVQPGERVLDLYGGIGYFTLPALVHGLAAHVVVCEWNPHAVQALQFNLRDNKVQDRATVLQGDCRVIATQHNLVDQFDRVSLGLLPSSEGGWQTAVRALRRDTGGWLHVHGNVPVKEAYSWLEWLCLRLKDYVRDDVGGRLVQLEWIVVAKHLEKVKSFAPTVNHYVADVYLGPLSGFFVDIAPVRTGFVGFVHPEKGLTECRDEIEPPSCALSPTGPLHQAWMR